MFQKVAGKREGKCRQSPRLSKQRGDQVPVKIRYLQPTPPKKEKEVGEIETFQFCPGVYPFFAYLYLRSFRCSHHCLHDFLEKSYLQVLSEREEHWCHPLGDAMGLEVLGCTRLIVHCSKIDGSTGPVWGIEVSINGFYQIRGNKDCQQRLEKAVREEWKKNSVSLWVEF